MKYTTRLDLEKEGLHKLFPSFRIQDPYGANGGVIGTLYSNNGNRYVIWLALGGFPNKAPKLYIIEPDPLLMHDGTLLSKLPSSHQMHLLEPDDYGHPQICHYNGQYWHPSVSMAKILMKARLWIHAYEQHLQTGENIDVYLSHM